MAFSTLISNVTLIDVEAGCATAGMQILVRAGRIESIARTPAGPYAREIDGSGTFVCPGLIDAHVHLFLDAGTSPRASFVSASDDELWNTATRNAGLAVSAGITTVRDCGGPAELLFRFQRAVEEGQIQGPRILSAGSPLTRPRGHCHFFGIEVSTPAEVRRAIDRQIGQGAVLVKLIASGGGLTPGTDPSEADLPLAIMREAVTAAHANGIHVAAHCHAVESIVRALDAGVDTVEHASFVLPQGVPQFNPDLAARIRDEGVVVCPTVIAGVRIAQTIRESGLENTLDRDAVVRLESRRRYIARFCESGVRLIAGTDCGVANTPFDSLLDELSDYQNAGMSPAEVLRSATAESARVLGRPLLGRIAEGATADLLLVNGNPLECLDYLRNPLLVMKEGEIVCDSRSASVPVS